MNQSSNQRKTDNEEENLTYWGSEPPGDPEGKEAPSHWGAHRKVVMKRIKVSTPYLEVEVGEVHVQAGTLVLVVIILTLL